MNRTVLIGISITLFLGFLIWLFMISLKAQPGEELLQEGRNHVEEGTKVEYKFNPPTSGDHYASWISRGFFDEPRMDGNLVHSMEHGYIIIWYDCEKKISEGIMNNLIKTVYADVPSMMTKGTEGSPSAKLSDMPKAFSDGSCTDLKKKLISVLEKNGLKKLIVTPRVGMDSPIILTAWGRMEKLSSLDEEKIKAFINAYRDNGPEKTNEE